MRPAPGPRPRGGRGRPSRSRQSGDATSFARDTRDYLGRLERLGFAGVVLVARDGEPLFAEGYGLADRERGVLWSAGTVSTVGSITKQFTGAAILALAEDGELRIEDPITAHFEGVPEDKRGITLHQLLTHSSGIVDLEGYGDWDPIGREEFVERILAQPLAFEPGSGYRYSNAGYSLLGAIVEQLTGGPYESFLRQRFFVPLGMYETGYVQAGWGEGRLAAGYRGEETWGTVLGRPMAEDGPYWVLRANGGIHTTAYDVLRWARALLDGRVLSPASMERLWAPHVREGEGADSSYGYGWAVLELEDGTKAVTHNGGNGIFFADLALVPAAGIVVFLQTNVASGNPYVEDLLSRIGYRLAAGRPYPEVPEVVAGDPARLAALAGEWELAGGGRLRATAEADALVVEPLDPAAFARLLSEEPPDGAALALGADRNGRLEVAARALLAGDAVPLHRLYGAGEVTLDRLSEVWTDRLAGFAERHGAPEGVEVLGTARRGERDFTVVRFRHEEGAEEVAFVWPGEPDGGLLGVLIGGLPQLRFRAEASGALAAWDPRSGGTAWLTPEGAGADARLRFGRGEATLEARPAGSDGPSSN